MTSHASLRRDITLVAGAIAAASLLVAITVHVAFAAKVRDAMPMTFAGIPDRFDEAVSIFANNSRLLAGLAAAAGLVAWMRCHADASMSRSRLGARLIVGGCDAVVGLLTLVNVTLVAAVLGAYGRPLIVALLPHGLLEIPAFLIGLVAYVRCRRGALTLQAGCWAFAAGLVLLAPAALLETYVR